MKFYPSQTKTFWALVLVFVAGFFALTTLVANATPNQQINYQGKLTDATGAAVADGTYNMRFWLLSSATISTTTPEWTEELTGVDRVQVTNGLFSVMLGSSTPFTGVDFNQTLYLGVEIGGVGGSPTWDGEMSPRKILGMVPAAFEAQQLDGLATTSFLRADADDTASGQLTFTGNTTFATSTFTLASSTVYRLSGDDLTDFTGSGLVLSSGALTVNVSESNLNILAAPIDGYVLQASSTAAGGFVWQATSSLGFVAGEEVTLAGEDYLSLSGQEITAIAIDPDNLSASDFGDFTCNGTNCSLDTDSVSDNEIDYLTVTLSDFNNDANFIEDITGSSFYDLADTPAGFTANRILYQGGSQVTDSPNFTFNGTTFSAPTTTLSGLLTMSGSAANIALGSNFLSGDGDDEGIFVDGSGNVGIGTTTPSRTLSVAGDAVITGALYDSTNTAGTNGQVLLSTGSGQAWTATSSLGLGTVTSVDFSVPTGLAISGNPITSAGTLALTYDTGYAAVLTASTTNWNNFYDTPSTVITDGDALTWTGNTLNVNDVTAAMLVNGDFGDFSCNGTTCAFDTATVASSTLNAPNWTDEYVLQASSTAAGGFAWVATSTLGFGGGGSSVTFGTDNQIPFTNAGGTDFDYSGLFTYDGSTLSVQTTGTADILNLFETGGTEVFTVLENGNVGIGEAAPSFALQVDSGDIRVERQTGTIGFYGGGFARAGISSNSSNDLIFETNVGAERARFTNSNGFFGIGDTSPDAHLEVSANGSTGGSVFLLSSADDNDGDLLTVLEDGNIGFGTSTDLNARLSIQSTSTTDILNLFETGGTEVFTVLENGNVGVGTDAPVGRLAVTTDGLSQTWTQVGSGFSLGSISIAALTALSSNQVAYVDTTNRDLRMYEFNGSTWSQIGADFNISGSMNNPSLTRLSQNRVAFIDQSGQDLRVYEFNGSTWSQIGSDLNISGISLPSIASLGPNRIAFLDNSLRDLQVYDFNGSTWSQIGDDYAVSLGGVITALSPNRVVSINSGNDDLQVFEFNGTTWSQVGVDFNISGTGSGINLTTLSPNRIAFFDPSNDDLRVYDFNGTTWSQVGSDLNISGITISPQLTSLSSNQIAFLDTNDDEIRTYRFSQPSFFAGNDEDYPYLAVSDNGFTTAEAMRINAGLQVFAAATGTNAINGTTSPALIVQGSSFFGGDILPNANLLYDLGGSSNRLANLWAETLNVGTSTWSIFNGADGRLSFSNAAEQGGSEYFSIDTTGNVGIGTTSPASKLDVWGDFLVGTSSVPTLSVTSNTQTVGINTLGGDGVLSIERLLGNSLPAIQVSVDTTDGGRAFNVYDRDNMGDVFYVTSNGGMYVSQDAQFVENVRIEGALQDSSGDAGTNGMVLLSTGGGTNWVATSSLGISGGSSVTFGTDNQIPFTNAGGTDLEYSPNFTFDGTTFTAPTTTLSGLLSMSGSVANIALGSNFLSGDGDDEGIFVDGSGNVGIGTISPQEILHVATGNIAIDRGQAFGVEHLGTFNDLLLLDTSNRSVFSGVGTNDFLAITAAGIFSFIEDGDTHMTIDLDGNVGIGTTSPASLLDVWGDFRVGTSAVPTLFADVSTDRVGIGTTTPGEKLTINNGNQEFTQTELTLIDSLNIGGNPNAFVFKDNYLFIGRDSVELKVYDISYPTDPVLVGTTTHSGTDSNMLVIEEYLYIAQSGSDRILIYDITDVTSPFLYSSSTDDGTVLLNGLNDMVLDGQYLYVSAGVDDGIQVFDVSEPGTPVPIAQYANNAGAGFRFNNLSHIEKQGVYLHAVATNGADNPGYSIYHAADPFNIYPVAYIASDGTNELVSTSDMVINNDKAYFTVTTGKFVTIDIANKVAPAVHNVYADDGTTNFENPIEVAVSGDYAYLVSQGTDDAVAVIDISSSTNPVQVYSESIGANPADVIVHTDGNLYTSSNSGHLVNIYDLPGVTAPTGEFGNLYANQSLIEDLYVTDSLRIEGDTSVLANFYTEGLLTVRGNASSTITDQTHAGISVLMGGLGVGTTSNSYGLNVLTSGTSGFFGVGNTTAGEYLSVLTDGKTALGTTSSNAQLTIQTTGTTDILNLFETGGTEVFTVLENGNIGIGSTTPSRLLSVAGDAVITGALYDSTNTAGTNGQVLLSTGSGQAWTSTSSLGFAESLFTDDGTYTYLTSLTDKLAVGTTTSIDGGNIVTEVSGNEEGLEILMFNPSGGTGILVNNPDSLIAGGSDYIRFMDAGNEVFNIDGGADMTIAGDISLSRGTATGADIQTLSIGGARSAGGGDFARLDFTNYDSNTGVVDYTGARISSQNDGSADDGDLRFYTANAGALGSTAALVINSSGNIGINNQSPLAMLSIQATTTTDILNLFETGGAEVFTVLENGNVGIGSSTPSSALSVVGDAGVTGTFNVGNPWTFDAASGLQTGDAVATFQREVDGIGGIAMRNSSDTANAEFRFQVESSDGGYMAFTQPGTNRTTGGNLFGQVRNTQSSIFTNGADRDLTLGTFDAGDVILGTNNTRRMTIDDTTGAISVGATAPGAISLFQVINGSDNDLISSVQGADATEYLGFGVNDGNGIITAGFSGSGDTGLVFRTSDTAEAERMRIDAAGNIAMGTSTALSALLSIQSTSTNDILNLFETGGTEVFTVLENGNVGIGSSTPDSLLSIYGTGYSGSNTFGIDQFLRTENSVASAVQFGNQFYLQASNTATTTIVGNIMRIEDSTTFGNTVRALEVQADRGVNTLGENTALSGFARTFGVRGTTRGDAGGEFEPAGGFFETEGTTQGNAIRGYSGSITTSALLSLFQDTSDFIGTGLLMNFGNAGGTFASTTASNFIKLQNGGTTLFSVNASGTVTIGEVGGTTNLASLQIGFGGICVDDDGSCTATTSGRITAAEYNTANSDLAEQYFSSEDLEPGEIVYLKGGLSIGRADSDVGDRVIGVVSTKPGLTLGANDVPTTPGETGYPIALTGRVPIKLSNENGPIKKGDQLMLSSIPGVAMKASSTGLVVGIALEDFDESRAYSDTYISQYGENIIVPEYVPVTEIADPRINDGCYFGGGGTSDEAPCVPLPVATTTDVTVAAANIAALEEAKERALRALARERSERAFTAAGQEVSVGQITMFVDLRYRYLDEATEAKLASLMNGTSTIINLDGEVEEVSVSLMDRMIDLTSRFFDGVLTLVGLKAETVTTDELCIGTTCVNEAQLIELLNNQAAPPGSATPPTPTPPPVDQGGSDPAPQPESTPAPEPTPEPPATTTESDNATSTPPAPEPEPTPDTGSSAPPSEPEPTPEPLATEAPIEEENQPEPEPTPEPEPAPEPTPEPEAEETPEPATP